MEIKDVSAVRPIDGKTKDQTLESETLVVAEKGAKPEESTSESSDTVTVSTNAKKLSVIDSRLKTNDSIASVNVLTETTDKLDKVFTSIEGIVAQAASQPNSITERLEKEGKQLLEEVDSLIQDLTAGNNPDTGNGSLADVERTVGKALNLISVNKTKAFGLEKLELTSREALLITQTNVARARAQLDNLKHSISDAAKSVKDLSVETDLAAVRSEPTRNTIRQADEAVRVTGNAKREIEANPTVALESFASPSAAAHL